MRNFKKNRNEVLIKQAIATTNNIIMETPHDIGQARGNWQTRIDGPELSQIDRTDPGGGQALEEVRKVAVNFGDNNKSIDVTNNLPYINRLNSGWSKQADPGYIERAIETTKVHFGDDYLLKDNK